MSKRDRSKKRFIPEGAIINPDGSWFYYFTEEEREEMRKWMGKNSMFGPAIGFGELICSAE